MTNTDKTALLSSSELFKGLSPAVLAKAAEVCERREFEPGELLFSQSSGRHIGVIVSGYAKVVKPGKGGSVTMSVLGPGDVFGAATLMGGELPTTEARAVKTLTALLFTEEAFLHLMDECFPLTINYCRYLIGRIRFLTERVECMAGSTAAEKLRTYFEKNSSDGVVRLNFSMDALAKALSLSRASLYRAMSELESSGRITRNGHEIRLLK